MSNHRRRWLPKTVELGYRISDVTAGIKSCGNRPFPHVDTEMAPEYKGCPTRLHLISVERGNPHEVWYDAGCYSQPRQPVDLTARQIQLLRRTRWSKKRRPAAERHREFITCRIGPQ